MQEIKKISIGESAKHPFSVDIATPDRLYKFRFENMTEFRDFLYIFLHVKIKGQDIPLFMPTEHVNFH